MEKMAETTKKSPAEILDLSLLIGLPMAALELLLDED